MNTLTLAGGSGLVVVAHPDDETIWMGGVILMNSQIKWTIVSLCRGDDTDRAPKFRNVCKYYGAKGIISDLEDEGRMNIKESVPEVQKRIKRLLPRRTYDYVFTHGANGEYGHPRHEGVARVISNLVNSNWLRAGNVFCFDYRLDEKRGIAILNTDAPILARLPRDVFKKKQDVVEKTYGFDKSSFEYRSCSDIETFRKCAH